MDAQQILGVLLNTTEQQSQTTEKRFPEVRGLRKAAPLLGLEFLNVL